jgi:GrpB-like predicted nucleotidyltransferase (UPF0157 family)
MSDEASGGLPFETMGSDPKRHPSLDDRFDPAVRIVPYDPHWPVRATEELRRLEGRLGPVAARYAALKRAAVARHPEDRLAYMASREAYMADLEARAS